MNRSRTDPGLDRSVGWLVVSHLLGVDICLPTIEEPVSIGVVWLVVRIRECCVAGRFSLGYIVC